MDAMKNSPHRYSLIKHRVTGCWSYNYLETPFGWMVKS
jgi:hypothetical protein